MENNISYPIISLLQLLIKELKVPVTVSTLRHDANLQPNVNSLLGISNLLYKWNISSHSYRISTDELADLPTPFISNFTSGDLKFFMVTSINQQNVITINAMKQKRTYPLSEFAQKFSGFVLIPDPDEYSGEPSYKKNRIKEVGKKAIVWLRNILLLFLVSEFWIYCFNFRQSNFRILLILLTKMTGIALSYLSLKESAGKKTRFTKRFCDTHIFNCEKALSSKGSYLLWGLLTWAEVGLLYFLSSFLIILFSFFDIAAFYYLSVAAVLVLPYSVYSIYYQARILRKWCLICCALQVILWIEFILFLPFIGLIQIPPASATWLILLTGIAIPVLIWIYLKPIWLRALSSEKLEVELNNFLGSPEVFQELLIKRPKHILPEKEFSVLLGNRDGSSILTIVLSPFCDHCAELYEEIESWLTKSDTVQFQIIFWGSLEHGNIGNRVIEHLIRVFNDDQKHFTDALRSWYVTKEYQSWAKKYPVRISSRNTNEIVLNQSLWCRNEKIPFTPYILFNGHELPEPYDVKAIQTLFN